MSADTMQLIQQFLLLLQYTLIFSSVLMMVALGGCFSEHSGVINLGLEGIMVIGALGGALVMRYLPAETSGLVMVLLVMLGAVVFGLVYSALLGVASINFKADQTIVGTALNMLGVAGATVLVKAINTASNPDNPSSIIEYGIPRQSFLVTFKIPVSVEGGAERFLSFEFNWFLVVAILMLVAAYVVLYKTRFGLRLMRRVIGAYQKPKIN